jgi:hypothetical protein
VLESYSEPLLRIIEWRATGQGNAEVLNETADLPGKAGTLDSMCYHT